VEALGVNVLLTMTEDSLVELAVGEILFTMTDPTAVELAAAAADLQCLLLE
jgi:hypothetical protein